MRVHIEFDDDVVREVDRLAGPGERTAFVRRAVLRAVEDAKRAAALRTAAGSLSDEQPRDWDSDPEAWVRVHRQVSARSAD
jgi:Arc/MetJ family transcription regulator